MNNSPELSRAARVSGVVLIALGSMSLGLCAEHNPSVPHAQIVEAATLPPTTVSIPETTIPTTTTIIERVIRQRASRGASGPRLATPPPAAPPIDGTKIEWMAEAGMAESDYDDADYIFTRESHWRADAENARGCIGVSQNCPDKNGNRWLEQACPDWRTNIICQIKRFSDYAVGRYGSWQAARAHKARHGWW